MGSLCAAPEDHIQIFIHAFGWGLWPDINRVHGFDDDTDIGRTCKLLLFKWVLLYDLNVEWRVYKKHYYSDQALVVIVCVHHVCVLFCILSPLPVWSLLSSYFRRWTTSNKIVGISPCWLLFTEVQRIWTINNLAPDIVLKPNVDSFRSMLFTVMWGTRLHRMSANVFSKSSSLLVCAWRCFMSSLCAGEYLKHTDCMRDC